MLSYIRTMPQRKPLRVAIRYISISFHELKQECFPFSTSNDIFDGKIGKEKTLSWTRRLEIAIDCARGLWFLHTYPEGCIVHRDIKVYTLFSPKLLIPSSLIS